MLLVNVQLFLDTAFVGGHEMQALYINGKST
jgi:hypothetical protein